MDYRVYGGYDELRNFWRHAGASRCAKMTARESLDYCGITVMPANNLILVFARR